MTDQEPELELQNVGDQRDPNQEEIPFLNEETLQNLANSYKELNDQNTQNNNDKERENDYIISDEINQNQPQIEREELSDDFSERNAQVSEVGEEKNEQKQIIQSQNQVKTEERDQLKTNQPKENEQQQQHELKDPSLQQACCRACIKKIRGKTCVCVVPASLRKQDISEKGCRTCGCKGCGDEANIKPELQKLKQESNQNQSQNYRQQQQLQKPVQIQEQQKQQLQNGCCRECMKAFSKTGKSCLCQVPKAVRKFELPPNGCNICGCKGCNPGDLRKESDKKYAQSQPQQHHQSKYSYSRSYSRSRSRSISNRRKYSRHRRSSRSPSYSRSHSGRRHGAKYYYRDHRDRSHSRRHRRSTDRYSNKQPQQQSQQLQQETVNIEQMNFQNFQNSVFGQYVQKTLSIFPPLMGFGIPERTPSYILGKSLENNE